MKKNLLISAPIYSLSGYGAHSRDIVETLWNSNKFNISCTPNGWGGSSSVGDLNRNLKDILDFTTGNKFRKEQPFTFIHIGIPPEFKKLSSTRNIGITAGLEADFISKQWVASCNEMDLVIVPSSFEKNVFINSGVKTPVAVVREGVDIGIYNNTELPFELPEVTTKFNFLSVGQWINYGLGLDRKQMGLLIQLFLTVFKDNEDVGLILRTYTNNHSTSDRYFTKERLKELKELNKSKASIYLMHGEMSERYIASLYNTPDVKALISLTSGEGWGRPLAEAMACDLPVMVTGWSGHMDFLDKENSTLFPFKLQPVPPGITFFERGMRWAYADINVVGEQMLNIVKDYEPYKEKAVKGGAMFRGKFNKEKTYEKLIGLIDA